MRKIEIGNKLYSVAEMDEYTENKDVYTPKNTALIVGDKVLPIRSSVDSGPGVYYQDGAMTANIVKPSDDDTKYNIENMIDLSNPKDIGEVIEKNQLIRDIQSDLMVSGKDNIFCLTITQKDTPEMKALKEAINSKQVDKKTYESRFTQFQNDMRLLKGNSITLSKLIGICNGFDISCILTLKDKEGAANPMEREISLDLTEGRPNKNETT